MNRRGFFKSLAILVLAPTAVAGMMRKEKYEAPTMLELSIDRQFTDEEVARLRSAYNDIVTEFNRHTHPTTRGPSSCPL